MSHVIDRRLNAGKKNTVNRQRFMLRCKKQIKDAVANAIGKRSITNIAQGEKSTIPRKDLSEPQFQAGPGGYRDVILPGNDQYSTGDAVPRPEKQDGDGGGEASDQGEGDDGFVFELTKDEFLELYFEDLALPDLVKKELARININKTVRAGVTTSGVANNLNILRSMRTASGRRMALASPYKRQLRAAQAALDTLQADPNPDQVEWSRLQELITKLQQKIEAVPFIDLIDIRYNHRVQVPSPATQAVMFCIMDVSGSMDEPKKDMAKRFFILLYLFLTKNYDKIDLVFIRHHTSAKIVDEHDFFYSRETGGTVVSSALEVLSKSIRTKYTPDLWNIYVAQASDGDNWNADSPYCYELLRDTVMPFVQYYAYIEDRKSVV